MTLCHSLGMQFNFLESLGLLSIPFVVIAVWCIVNGIKNRDERIYPFIPVLKVVVVTAVIGLAVWLFKSCR